MPPDDGPVTKADLNVISTEIKALRDLVENELSHLKTDVDENTAWRLEFMKENGPWRKQCSRTDKLFWALVIMAVVLVVDGAPTLAALIGSLL